MTKTEVQRLKERLQSEYTKKLEALALVEQMLAEDSERSDILTNGATVISHAATPQTANDDEDDFGNTETLISQVSGLLAADPEKKWTVNRIEQDLLRKGFKFLASKPTASIHTCITKLKKRGQIRVIRHGKGSMPSLYTWQKA